MSTTSKSPKKVAAVAYRIARDALPEHSSRYSPKKYTQPQLLVCLVLRAFFKTEYRGIVEILNDGPDLCQVFELQTVPHFTTLRRASKRLLRFGTADRPRSCRARRTVVACEPTSTNHCTANAGESRRSLA